MHELKKVIAEQTVKMCATGLRGAPHHTSKEDTRAMMEVWHDALTSAGYTDADARRVAASWRRLTRSAERWFYPRDLLATVRASIELDTPALPEPEISEAQRLKNVAKFQEARKLIKRIGQ